MERVEGQDPRGTLCVYILRCSDGTLYVGSSEDLNKRIIAHNRGRAAEYTAHRRPVTMAYAEEFDDETSAVRRERQLKRWSRAKKEALISGATNQLKALSKRRG